MKFATLTRDPKRLWSAYAGFIPFSVSEFQREVLEVTFASSATLLEAPLNIADAALYSRTSSSSHYRPLQLLRRSSHIRYYSPNCHDIPPAVSQRPLCLFDFEAVRYVGTDDKEGLIAKERNSGSLRRTFLVWGIGFGIFHEGR